MIEEKDMTDLTMLILITVAEIYAVIKSNIHVFKCLMMFNEGVRESLRSGGLNDPEFFQ